MSDLDQPIDPDRMMAAVDAIYRVHAQRASEGGLTHYPPDLMGTPLQPEAFDEFSRSEIEEATRFLERLGLLEQREPPPYGLTA